MLNKQSTNNAEIVADKQLNSRLQECPIAIVGMASVFAESRNLGQFWDNIVESVNAIQDIPENRWAIDDYYSADKKEADKTYCKRGGFLPEIEFDPMEFGLPPNILELTDITQLMALVVARDVLADAGISDENSYDRDKVGITLGVGGGQKLGGQLVSRLQGPVLDKVLKASGVSDADRAVIIDKFKKAYVPWEENSFPGLLGNVIAGRIANRFNFGGTNCVVDAACAGSLAAIKMAVSELLEYRSQMMISGGICCDNSPFMYLSFSKTPAFTEGEDIRPFDDESNGMMVGEGVGMIALKRLSDAEHDGDKIYAVIKGIGSSSDGRFKSIYAPRPEGQLKALKRAYADAGFDPQSCGLIEAHGTGTKAGDAAEFSGLNMLFSDNKENRQHIALGSVKSQIGHTKAAAGTAGLIKAALALHHKVLPATINVDTPNKNLDIEKTALYINNESRPWMPRADGVKRRAGISAFGFGGTNFHFVLEEYKEKQTAAYRLNEVPQTVLIAAADKTALIESLENWSEKLSVSEDELVYQFNALITANPLITPAVELARCGFTAKNAAQAKTAITQILKQLTSDTATAWSKPTGIYYRESGLDTSGKVVALFSGQGSQYVNMGRDLVCNFPSMLDVYAQMDKQFSAAGLNQLSQTLYPIPVFSDEKRQAQEAQLRLTEYAQPAIGSFSMGLYKTFQQAGFNADFAAGHSFGELTALWAAGVVSEDDYMTLARSRGQAMAAPSDPDFDAGSMIAVVGEPADVAADIKEIAGVSIANYNSNNQVVVAGVTSQVAVASEKLQEKGYKVVQLPVSAAFHTELVGHAQKPFAEVIDTVDFNSPKIPVYANGSARAHSSDGTQIKECLKNHILESVHFRDEVDNLYNAGGRIFIEFGPKNVLTRLVDNILTDKDDVTTIAINANPKKSADLQLRLAALEMAVLGVQLANIDPYNAVVRPSAAPKRSLLAMKLSGAAYVSPKTQQAFTDCLTDGWKLSNAEPKVVEKEVVKEVVVEKVVEKLVYVNTDGTPVDSGSAAQADNSGLAKTIEQSVASFVEHQAQLLDVHQQYMQGPQEYAKTFQSVLQAQAGATQLPESLDKTLAMYHDFQTETLRAHEAYLNSQTDNMQKMLASIPATAQLNPVVQTPVTATPEAQIQAEPQVESKTVKTVSLNLQEQLQKTHQMIQADKTSATVVTEVTANVATVNTDKIADVMLDVVADKTGYPAEMLELSMDMEADLGIDSIKRVEILGAVQDEIADLPELNAEDLAEKRTLGEIVSYMQSQALAVAISSPAEPAATIDLNKIESVMLSVVADKTGYPAEMLELGMDMEADLGIDSIKRVEILGAVQDEIADLPELNAEELAEKRTLGEIVSYMQSQAPVATVQITQAEPVTAVAIDLGKIEQVMLSVVADKTGYPAEMLELGMDMEADLGIDSIKRVEILGAVQDEIADLPELDAEDLAEQRTLGEIVSYMQSQAPVAPVQITQAEPVTAVAIDLGKIEQVMLSVVADKTGYPAEMLELGMDMEADLGIDSIKRVEILGAVQDEIAELPELDAEKLAEQRTLGQIVDYMSEAVQQESPVSAIQEQPVRKQTLQIEDVQQAPSATVAIKHLAAAQLINREVNGENLLLVDDGEGASVRLADKLTQLGWAVTVLKASWVEKVSSKNFAETVNVIELNELNESEIQTILDTQNSWSAVIYLHPNTAISGIEYPLANKQGVLLAFLLAKLSALAGNSNETRSSFMVLTRQGGAFGVENNQLNSDLVQAGLSGLVKTLAHEWPNVFCRVIDLPSKFAADKVANIIVDELNDQDFKPVEVGFNNNGRLTLVPEKTDSYSLAAGNSIDQDSLFLVSGGAKGVTAHCVIQLAKQYQCKFILLGRSAYNGIEPEWAKDIATESELKKAAMQYLISQGEKPSPVAVGQFIKPVIADREIRQTLDAISAVGGIAEYVCADVTDLGGVQNAVQPIIDIWGEVTGIIHGAGVLADKFIEQKTLSEFESVYSTKMDGLLSLLACCSAEQIKHLVLFSSAAGFYGNPGQSDYAIANEILNKTAYRFKALYPSAQVLSFNWGPWDGGMVTPELKRMFNDRGVYIIPLAAGAQLLVSELSADTNRCPQILVGNDMGGEAMQEESVKKPLVSRLVKTLLAANNPFFSDHQIGENLVFPTVCAIAWMADACRATYPGYHYQGLQDYKLFKGIVFDGQQAQQYFIDLQLLCESDGQLSVAVKVSSENAQGKTQFHYGATLLLAKQLRSAPVFTGELPELPSSKQESAIQLYRDGTLFHGDSLQGFLALEQIDAKGLQMSCRITAAVVARQGEFAVDCNNVFANDLVYQALLIWVKKQLGLGSLPSATLAWTVYREVKVEQEFYLQLTVTEHKGSMIGADILLIDKDKQIMAEVKGVQVTSSAGLNNLFKGHA